jgi:hypothetical protein
MAADHDPYTGLLVSMHGAGLYNDRYNTFRLAEQHFSADERVLVDEFLREQALFQEQLAGRSIGNQHDHVTTDPTVWYHYLMLQVWDRLSLQFVFRLAAGGDIAPLPIPGGGAEALRCISRGQFSLALDPYPFAKESWTFPISARQLPDRRYRNPEEFLEILSRTPVTQLECKVSRF